MPPHRAVVLLLLLLLAPGTSGAQRSQSPNVQVEVLGLQRWTLRMLRDSIRVRVPGQTLEDAACAVTLRDSLGFADAVVNDVTVESAPGVRQHYLVLRVIEPGERWRINRLPPQPDSFNSLRPDYASLILPITDSAGVFWLSRFHRPLAYYWSDSASRAAAIQRAGSTGGGDAERLWRFLDGRRSGAHGRDAQAALRRDGFFVNRIVAAAVLANFGDHDSTWLVLTDALRDPAEGVRGTAALVLSRLPSRRVDWKLAAPTLRLLLAGANLGAMDDVMQMLARTEVDPALARQILRGNSTWTLRMLRASSPSESAPARRMLVALNGGRDLGSAAAWARWIARL